MWMPWGVPQYVCVRQYICIGVCLARVHLKAVCVCMLAFSAQFCVVRLPLCLCG